MRARGGQKVFRGPSHRCWALRALGFSVKSTAKKTAGMEMSEPKLSELDQALIEQACAKLVNQYALASDRADYVALSNMYAPEGVFYRPTAPDVAVVGRAAILAAFQSRGPTVNRHVMSDIVVDAVSATEATGDCYIVLYRAAGPTPDGALPAMNPVPLVGQFKDRFVKLDGQWLFAERRGSLAYAAS